MKFTSLILATIITALVLPTSGIAQPTTGVWEGEDVIECEMNLTFWGPYLDCSERDPHPDRFGARDFGWPPELEPDARSRVTLTIEWVANSPDTRELELSMSSDAYCENTAADPNCSRRMVRGESPLSVTFEGDAAKGWLYPAVFLFDPCDYSFPPSCPELPVRVARDQEYHWRWTYE